MGKKVRITWVKSWIGCPEDQRATVRALGLKRLRQTVEREATPPIMGMVQKVRHLVRYELVNEAVEPVSPKKESTPPAGKSEAGL